MAKDKYVRFDWAAKRMLRDKANFCVLEGLITVLLGEEVHIENLLPSAIINDVHYDRFPALRIEATNSKDEKIIVEIQITRELYYLECLCYGVPHSITEHIHLGESYEKVKKVYSISILYFDLGKGADYLYHGQTTFKGVHTGDTLQTTTKEKDVIEMKTPEQVFPEYYLIRVNEFNKVATTPLEEWLDYLRSGNIKDDTTVPGLQQARQNLLYMQMSREEQISYDRHLEDIMVQNDCIASAIKEGRAEGRAEGEAIGIEKSVLDSARKMIAAGVDEAVVISALSLTPEQIATLRLL